ncbi:MAG: nucleotidyltransferase domain-containing protein [Campylobacterales bacterium]|nr:nucleotidyltransferase domain-containing protein [Campylobacterales bacterium]
MTKENIIEFLKEIKPKLQKDGIKSLGLFGSWAKGSNHFASDIDILVETDESFVKRYGAWGYFDKLNEIRDLIKKKFSLQVDIFDKSSGLDKKQNILNEVIYV